MSELTEDELKRRAIDNYRFGMTATTDEFIEDIANNIVNAGLSFKEMHVINVKSMAAKKAEEIASNGGVDYKYTVDMGVDAVEYMMDNRSCVDDTLDYVMVKHQKTEEYMQNIRHKRFYSQSKIARTIEKKKAEVIEQWNAKQLPHNRIMRSTGTTPYQYLEGVYEVVTLSDRMDAMERHMKQMEEEIFKLKLSDVDKTVRLAALEHNVEVIDEVIGISKQAKRDKAKELRDNGMTNKEVAKLLGVSVRTIKYWYKDNI